MGKVGGSVLENCKMQKGGLERKINKFRTDYGLTDVIQIEASICDGALSSISTMLASKLQPFQAVEVPMYIQLVLSMADGLSDQENEQKRLLGEMKLQLQEKRDLCLKNEGHFSAYNDFYRELDQLNKELEVLKTSPDSDPREVDRKEVEVTAITKMLSRVGATIDSGWLKEDLDSLQVSLLLRVPLEVLGGRKVFVGASKCFDRALYCKVGETSADKSSHVPELDENITELLELDASNIELSEGFQHGKAVVKSGDRVEDPEAEPFVVENHGKETIGQDSSKLSTDNQEGSLETTDKVEDAEDVETLLIIADILRKKCKRQQEKRVHHPNPKKIKIQVISNVGHRHCAQEDLGHFDQETPLLTQFRVPHLSEDNKPALIININDLLIVTHNKREGPSPFNVDMLHFWKVKEDDNLIHYVHHFAKWFVLGASQIVEVYVWNTSHCQDLEKRLELCLPQARRCLNGWIAKEACSRSSWLDQQGDQMLFLVLGTFWKEFPQFNKDNTLLLDDKYLRCCLNNEDSYVILPSLKKQSENHWEKFMHHEVLPFVYEWKKTENRSELISACKFLLLNWILEEEGGSNFETLNL
ncbi:hypothetical protein L7F22_005479 [Adiantum nelumboides]|nr:hypothetical protein [Adiantum nelumboides]